MDGTTDTLKVLVAENIFVSFGAKEILKGVALRAPKDKITGLLGRNGSGKSTMLQVICGILQPADATIKLDGAILRYAYRRNKLVNYLPQFSFLPKQRKLRKILDDYDVPVSNLLTAFPVFEQHLNDKVAQLSGGMERLFAVVLLLLAESEYTLLDEPFTHIMPLHIEALKQLILQQRLRKGIILTDHLYEQLLEVSDDIYLMKEGQSLLVKSSDDLVLHGYLNA
ncbi:MAG: ATP-binding cassette domain-containing protein [Flavipsychrobacter sp.]